MASGLVLLSVAATTACNRDSRSVEGVSKSEEYAVYRSVINALFLDPTTSQRFGLAGETRPRMLVIAAQTALEGFVPDSVDPATTERFLLQELPGLERSLVQRFINLNGETMILENRFEVAVPILLIPRDSARAVLSAGGWAHFYRRYPNSQGLLELSRVVFGHDSTSALVYAGNIYGIVDGAGYYLLFNRTGAGWLLVGSALTWVS